MRHFRISPSITNRKTDSLERYLNEIGKIDLLSPEEELELAKKINAGDLAAADKLIKANLRFVVSVAKGYQDNGLRLSDLISEGNKGLIKACGRFDETKGFKFISFAVWWIRQSIMASISDNRRIVRLPGNQIVGITKAYRAAEVLEQRLGRFPTVEEIAEEMGISDEQAFDFLSHAPLSQSLDALLSEDGETTVKDLIPNENAPAADHRLYQESLAIDIHRFLTIVSERERKIIYHYYGFGGYPQTTLDDMVSIFKLSKERIRQLKDKAIKTLQRSSKSALLREYLY